MQFKKILNYTENIKMGINYHLTNFNNTLIKIILKILMSDAIY